MRQHHGERICAWVTGKTREYLGVSHRAADAVDALLQPLRTQFRRDLGIVCESHHEEDLGDVNKYRVSQPYGKTDDETANLQYAAVLLRTADLLHITQDRAPSVAFRVIDPADPVSQREWAKQKAVTNVRSQVAEDKEGNKDPDAPRDTIEVSAYFTDPVGFFGLISYLRYVDSELQRSCDWVRSARQKQGVPHEFPWRHVDDSLIETEGFVRDTFEFTIDQAKMLDLLTGHTLYNDTSVVIRELAQNALDAVRFQHYLDVQANPDAPVGRVVIHWDSQERVLTVQDSGTGMSQQIIEEHLLQVGASRYQDDEFRREHADFWSISRFGIGILAAFMIADNVEIITCHPEDEEARHLFLRSLHGRYLISLLDKETDEDAKRLSPHGTVVKLKVRPSAEVPDVVQSAHGWIVVPRCEVTVSIDDDPVIAVGFQAPKEALAHGLREAGLQIQDEACEPVTGNVRVDEYEREGVTLAYALRWSDWFREWSFLTIREIGRARGDGSEVRFGTCIEGVRVEATSPGFHDPNVIALANVTGPRAPRTNVARSGLEATPDRDAMLRTVYSIYLEHVQREVEELAAKRGFSLAWAAKETTYLLRPIFGGSGDGYRYEEVAPTSKEVLLDAAEHVLLILVERNGNRECVSLADLAEEPRFWTVESPLVASAERLIQEVPGTTSLSTLMSGLAVAGHDLPGYPLVCALGELNPLLDRLFEGVEVAAVRVYPQERRIDLGWECKADPPRWRAVSPDSAIPWARWWNLARRETIQRRASEAPFRVCVGRGDLELDVPSENLVLATGKHTYVVDTPLAAYLGEGLDRAQAANEEESGRVALALLAFVDDVVRNPRLHARSPQVLQDVFRKAYAEVSLAFDCAQFCELLASTQMMIFDPSAWARSE